MNIRSYSRGATLSMIAAVVLVLIIAPRRSAPRSAQMLLVRVGFAISLTFVFLGIGSKLLTDYLDGRDARISTSTLNGRTLLWSESLEKLNELGRAMYGVGYSASRVLLVSTRSWAGTAHSGYLQLILDVGYLGTAAISAALVVLGIRTWTSLDRESRRVFAGLVLFLGIQAGTSDSMVLPGPATALIFVLLVAGIARDFVPRNAAFLPEASVRMTR